MVSRVLALGHYSVPEKMRQDHKRLAEPAVHHKHREAMLGQLLVQDSLERARCVGKLYIHGCVWVKLPSIGIYAIWDGARFLGGTGWVTVEKKKESLRQQVRSAT